MAAAVVTMGGRDVDEKAAREMFQNEENSKKRSYQWVDGPSEARGENMFAQDMVERSILEEAAQLQPSSGLEKKAKAPRLSDFDQTFNFMNGLESPGPWQRQADASLDDPLNPTPTNLHSLTASSFSPREGDRERLETSPLVSRQVNSSRPGPHPGQPAYPDPHATWAYYGQPVYESGAYHPNGTAAVPNQQGPPPTNTASQPASAVPVTYYTHYPYANGGMAPVPQAYAPPYEQHGSHPYPPPYTMAVHPSMNTDGSTHQSSQQHHQHTLQAASTYQLQGEVSRVVTNDSSNSESFNSRQPSQEEEPTTTHQTTKQKPRGAVLMFIEQDNEILSDYQIFLRKNIQFFQADAAEVSTATPGRKKPVKLGQVGMRCIHCADVRIQRRASATVYFPSKLKGLYQAAQNIGTTHFRNSCPNMPPDLKEKAKTFQVDGKRATAGHGGKKYWADAAGDLGIVETEDGLRFFTHES